MRKVLVVEDDQDVRNLYKQILENAGFEITTAVDGEEGLAKILEGGFSLILLDIMLPKIDGIEILRKLKSATPQKPNGKIILLTNISQESVFKEAATLGAKLVLVKTSINPDQLVEKVKQLVM